MGVVVWFKQLLPCEVQVDVFSIVLFLAGSRKCFSYESGFLNEGLCWPKSETYLTWSNCFVFIMFFTDCLRTRLTQHTGYIPCLPSSPLGTSYLLPATLVMHWRRWLAVRENEKSLNYIWKNWTPTRAWPLKGTKQQNGHIRWKNSTIGEICSNTALKKMLDILENTLNLFLPRVKLKKKDSYQSQVCLNSIKLEPTAY